MDTLLKHLHCHDASKDGDDEDSGHIGHAQLGHGPFTTFARAFAAAALLLPPPDDHGKKVV